jgi:formyltetrahydrofolate deformylase
MAAKIFYLTLTCKNGPGIVAAVATYIYQSGGDIQEAHQFDDVHSGRFFMRVNFSCDEAQADVAKLRGGFMPIVERFGLTWTLRSPLELRRVMLMVSKLDHCLNDLLYRWRIGELPMTITAIVSNHPRETFASLDFGTIPFHHMPVDSSNKPQQEQKLWDLVCQTGTDMVVLARYMQILSDEMSSKLAGRCINVHHSFLPGFKGAKPYHQAHARGIKLIGATAHLVTSDLDEGPIIEQDVTRVTHSDAPEDLVRKGRDLERLVLARALRYYTADRILINGGTAVVFAD